MKIGVKMKKVKDAIDTKAIEEKALNHFKSFIEDSKVTYSGAYPFSIPGLQSAVRSAKIGSFLCPFIHKRTKKWIRSTRTRNYCN